MSPRQVLLGDLIHIKHGFAFKGEFFSDSGKYILLTPGNCAESGGLKLKGDREKFYSGDFPSEFILSQGDLIVVMTDLVQAAPILGGAFLIPEDDRFLHNQRLGLVTLKDAKRLDKNYLYYALNHDPYRSQVRGSATGVTVRHTAPERIYRCTIPVPTLAEQKQIAGILSAYDDLIANNRRRIQLLERAARELYKEWFVRLRFPGHAHTRIVDGVPEGWERRMIGEVCETIGGGTPSTRKPEYWDSGEITWVVPTDVTRNECLALLDSEKKITHLGLRESSAKLVPPETILMTSRASIGYFAMMDKEVCTNQGFISIIPNANEMRMYLLHNFMHRVEEIRSNAGGTTFKEITKGRFRNMQVVVPPQLLLVQFEELAYLLFQQTRILQKQRARLTQARDLLLPRLMRGELFPSQPKP